ncbi:MAG: hypothetical protein PHP54_05480 [Clostridia bacterium]|nr:hypothetical protein [Clostridia bacterium]
MAVDQSKIMPDAGYFAFEATAILANRDVANNSLNTFLDDRVIELNGDPAFLKFIPKKINFILENENEWALNKTTGDLKFQYNTRLNTIKDLAKQAEQQIKLSDDTLKLSGEAIEQMRTEIQEIKDRNVRIEQENAGLKEKIKSLEEHVEKINTVINRLNADIAAIEGGTLTPSAANERKALKGQLSAKITELGNFTTNIANFKGELATNEKSIVSADDLKIKEDKLNKDIEKQTKAYTKAQKIKTNLVNEFKKDKIDLNISSAEAKTGETPDGTVESTAKEEKSKEKAGSGSGSVGAPVQAAISENARTPKELINDMFKRFKEKGKIDAEDRKRILSGMGYSDLTDMLPHMSYYQRMVMRNMLDKTINDVGKPTEDEMNEITNFMQAKFGVGDASSLIENDFKDLDENQLKNMEIIISKFNNDPDAFNRKDQIFIDDFIEKISLHSLRYQLNKSGVFGRAAEVFKPGKQARKDIESAFNTFSVNKSSRLKEAATNDFVTEMGAKVRTDDEISMSKSTSIEDKAQSRGYGVTR